MRGDGCDKLRVSVTLGVLVVALGLGVAFADAAWAAEKAVVIPAPAVDNPKVSASPQTAVIAAGCFWGVQGVYQHVRGVQRALSGYSGGTKATAEQTVRKSLRRSTVVSFCVSQYLSIGRPST